MSSSSRPRSSSGKAAVGIAVAATVWVIGSALFYRSGDINPAGVLPTFACLLALGAAIGSNKTWMWVGAVLVLIFSVTLLFSVGLVVAPAALALMVGSALLSRSVEHDGRNGQSS